MLKSTNNFAQIFCAEASYLASTISQSQSTGRWWITVKNIKMYNKKHRASPTIKDILCIQRNDMATVNDKMMDSNSQLFFVQAQQFFLAEFIYDEYDNCGYISVAKVENGEDQDDGASPVNENKVAKTIKRSCLQPGSLA